jgi:hypothetical protein
MMILGGKQMEHKLMTEQEKAKIVMKSIEMEDAGRKEEAMELLRTIPLPPYMAKFIKEKIGVDFLVDSGYNLAEAEVEYGSGWLAS